MPIPRKLQAAGVDDGGPHTLHRLRGTLATTVVRGGGHWPSPWGNRLGTPVEFGLCVLAFFVEPAVCGIAFIVDVPDDVVGCPPFFASGSWQSTTL